MMQGVLKGEIFFMLVEWLKPRYNLLAIVVLIVFVVITQTQKDDNPFSGLKYLGESAGRIVDRNMSFYEGYDATPGWERTVHRLLFGTQNEVKHKNVQICRDVLAYFEQYPEKSKPWALLNTQARLLVLLAETGQTEEFDYLSLQLELNPEEDELQGAIRFVYGETLDERGLLEIEYGVRLLPLGWTSQKINYLLAKRMGDKRRADFLLQLMQKNAEEIRSRLRMLVMAVFGLMSLGAFIFVRSRYLKNITAWPAGVLVKPWPAITGMLVLFVAIVLAIPLIYIVTFFQNNIYETQILTHWKTIILYLPLLWIMYRFLLKPQGLTFRTGFGLKLGRVPLKVWLPMVLVLVTIDWFGSTVIAFTGWKLGFEPIWTESVHEPSMFGSPTDLFFSSVEIIVWAAVLEEIVYRGLIFVSLRSFLTPTLAIILSSVFFASMHFYSLIGFIVVLWSGIVLAYSYERFQSLLPGICVHASGNLLYLTTVWLFYR